ncbi:hypothetical protein B0H14DRAFT_2570092 [Mycena olivaceomarginata]|nr:hypothetical protein B0H14DRAFT_2570092 [Mycena olivaceomarginata]
MEDHPDTSAPTCPTLDWPAYWFFTMFNLAQNSVPGTSRGRIRMCNVMEFRPVENSGGRVRQSIVGLGTVAFPFFHWFNFTDFRLRGNVGGHVRHLIVIHSSAEPQRFKKWMATAGSAVVVVKIQAYTNLGGDKPLM